MMKKSVLMSIAVLAITALSACTSVQYNHYFKEGYQAKADKVFVTALLGLDQFNIHGQAFSDAIMKQLTQCGYEAHTNFRNFNYPRHANRKGYSFKTEEAVEDGLKAGADGVIVVDEIERFVYKTVYYYDGLSYSESPPEEGSRGFNVRYYDSHLQEVVWMADIYMNARKAGFRAFTKVEKAENLSKAIVEHMAKDGIFAECVPTKDSKT